MGDGGPVAPARGDRVAAARGAALRVGRRRPRGVRDLVQRIDDVDLLGSRDFVDRLRRDEDGDTWYPTTPKEEEKTVPSQPSPTDLDGGKVANDGAIRVKLNAALHDVSVETAGITATVNGTATAVKATLYQVGTDDKMMKICDAGNGRSIFIYPRGVFLNKLESVLRIFPHQPVNKIADTGTFFVFLRQRDSDERPCFRVHRRLLQLAGVHFTQPLEAAYLNFFALECAIFNLLPMRIIAGVD